MLAKNKECKMQNVRSNITRLKNTIEAKFPESGDIFEFPGVTRSGLIQLMESASAESYELLDKEEDFEVVLLKRKIAQPIDTCRDYLSDYSGRAVDKKDFDSFVRSLTDIRDQIRLTYLICNKSGLRTEEEIQNAKESLESLITTKKQLQSEVNNLIAIRDELKTKLDSVAEADSSSQEHLEAVQAANSTIDALNSKAAASFEVVTKYEQQITEARESANENSAEISSLVSKGQKASQDLKQVNQKLEEITNATTQQQSLNSQLAEEITNTLAAANRVGMAGSFHSRKQELRASLIIWGLCFVVSICSILAISIWLIFPYIQSVDTSLKLEDIGLKILIVAPLVWLAWMSAKQYGYVARIREDYSFKYATAMAFEGYKKHAQEIDDALLEKLMSQAIEAVGQNPIRLYSNGGDHASPMHEVIDKVMETARSKGANKAPQPTAESGG